METSLWRQRWCLLVIAVSVAAGILGAVARSVAVPGMSKYWIVLDVLVIALVSYVGCFIGNELGSNRRSKALLGLIFSWMMVGPLVGIGVGALYGNWVRFGCMLALAVALLAVVWLWRNWFRQPNDSGQDER